MIGIEIEVQKRAGELKERWWYEGEKRREEEEKRERGGRRWRKQSKHPISGRGRK